MRKRLTGFAVTTLVLGTSANAQLGGLMGKMFGLPNTGVAGGAYQTRNQIRTYITSDPDDDDVLYQKLVAKASDMAQAKGFSRIGVTKTSCTTATISGSPRSTSCYIVAVMLNEHEAVELRGKQEVQYYNVEDVRRGVAAPPLFSR